jgi:CheY-like chemotaxis protein
MEDARILIVDDQPDFRAMLTVILQRSGFQVFVAADGEEALRLVSEIAPDLILMDVSMPGMDGIEAAHRIRQLTSAPILFLSALGGPETVARGRAARRHWAPDQALPDGGVDPSDSGRTERIRHTGQAGERHLLRTLWTNRAFSSWMMIRRCFVSSGPC